VRLAFGRFSELRHRQAGEDVVLRHYNKERRFFCDCRPDAEHPPQLFLVTGSHIRREADGKGTPHDEGCDFARDPHEQKKIVLSYREPEDEYQLNLVRNFGDAKKIPVIGTVSVTTRRTRPTLARTLCSLLHAASLDRFFSQTPLHGNRDLQLADLKDAAARFLLAPEEPLDKWLAFTLGGFYSLREKLNRSLSTWKRPHGLFICSFDRIENNTLYPRLSEKKPIAVTGKLTIFGEGENHNRPPYLVIGLLSLPDQNAKSVELLNAYAHPCVAWNRLTLVDSQNERDTLALLIKCRDWLAANHNVTFTIEKPLFDKGTKETDDPREVCIPDFILRSKGSIVRNPLIVVETMGYDTVDYRTRKARMHSLFVRVGPGPFPVPVIEHDRFLANVPGRLADSLFLRKILNAILGDVSFSLPEF